MDEIDILVVQGDREIIVLDPSGREAVSVESDQLVAVSEDAGGVVASEDTVYYVIAGGGQGPPGAMGSQGSPGIGQPGTDGEDGADSFVPGPQGNTGLQGIQGIQGFQGVGIPGQDAEDGEDSFVMGPQGNQGLRGIQGLQGPGIPGMDGSDGEDGFSIPGPAGQIGPAGADGAIGPPGQDGAGEGDDEGFLYPPMHDTGEFFKLLGRPGGQIAIGGTGVGDDLAFYANDGATNGDFTFYSRFTSPLTLLSLTSGGHNFYANLSINQIAVFTNLLLQVRAASTGSSTIRARADTSGDYDAVFQTWGPSGVHCSWGMDNSETSDPFVFSTGGTLGTNNVFSITISSQILDFANTPTVGGTNVALITDLVTDHGALTGLSDDDHTIYLLADGTRALGGTWDIALNTLDNIGVSKFGEVADPGFADVNELWLHAEDVAGIPQLHINNATHKWALMQDQWIICRNTSGVTINKGDVVYITGTTGARPEIARADANNADHAVGLAAEEFLNLAYGHVVVHGYLNKVDTSAWVAATVLYMSETPGQPTSTEPSHPAESQTVGNVIFQHAVNGIILVESHDHRRHNDGTHEDIFYLGGSATDRAVLDITASALTASRTFTFPDTAGQLAILTDVVTDHGALTGLADDDHTQYMLDAGTSVDNGIPRHDGTDGRTMQVSGVTISDNNDILMPLGTTSSTENWIQLNNLNFETATDNPAGVDKGLYWNDVTAAGGVLAHGFLYRQQSTGDFHLGAQAGWHIHTGGGLNERVTITDAGLVSVVGSLGLFVASAAATTSATTGSINCGGGLGVVENIFQTGPRHTIQQSSAGALGPHLYLNNMGNAIADATAIQFLSNSALRAEIRSTVQASPFHGDLTFSTGVTTLTERLKISASGTLFSTVAGNEVLHLQEVASAVNYLEAFPSITAVAPTFRVAGDNTDIGLILQTKGVGVMNLANGSASMLLLNKAAGATSVAQILLSTSNVFFSNTVSGGSIFYGTVGSGSHLFYTDNNGSNLALSLTHAASVAQHFQMHGGATAIGAYQTAIGETNTNAFFSVLGTGFHAFFTGGETAAEQLRISHTASSVDDWNFTGAATGANQVVIGSARGTDTHVSMGIKPKGDGCLIVGASIGVTSNPTRDLQVFAAQAARSGIAIQASGITTGERSSMDFIASNGTALASVGQLATTGSSFTLAASTEYIFKTGSGVFNSGTERMKLTATTLDITGVGQIAFPATQAASSDANTLDDYEEGTWTPSIGGTATYTTQQGTYTKVGDLVTVFMLLDINVIGTGSTGTITGLPFTVKSGDPNAIGTISWTAMSASYVVLQCAASAGGTSIIFQGITAAATGLTTVTPLQSGSQVTMSMSYKV